MPLPAAGAIARVVVVVVVLAVGTIIVKKYTISPTGATNTNALALIEDVTQSITYTATRPAGSRASATSINYRLDEDDWWDETLFETTLNYAANQASASFTVSLVCKNLDKGSGKFDLENATDNAKKSTGEITHHIHVEGSGLWQNSSKNIPVTCKSPPQNAGSQDSGNAGDE